VPVVWMLSSDAFPKHPPGDADFVALDGELLVGRVYRIGQGTDRGQWLWTMLVDLPSPRITPRNGTAPTRGEAGRKVIEAYERLLSRGIQVVET
jgi:hypothetical protein